MDDFQTGPHSFTFFVDSSDIFNLSQPHTGELNVYLPKPIELTSGQWEVCLKRMFFSPLINPLNEKIENCLFIYYHESDTIFKGETLEVDASAVNPIEPKLNDYVEIFNNAIPEKIKSRVNLSVINGKLHLYADMAQVKFKDFSLARILGFQHEVMYPFNIESKKTVVAPFFSSIRNGYDICKVVTDFTAPIAYGSSFQPIIGVSVVPDSVLPVDILFPCETYAPVIKSCISKIYIRIQNLDGEPFLFSDLRCPIILQFHFRRRSSYI